MDSQKKMDLANLVLDVIKRKPVIEEHIITETGMEPNALPFANLLWHLEDYWDKATDLKTILDFFIDEIGVHSQCVLIVATGRPDLYELMVEVIAENTEGYYVARAHSLEEANQLITFFDLLKLGCGFITEYVLGDGLCEPIIEKCPYPSCVIGSGMETYTITKLLALGTSGIVPLNNDFLHNFKSALIEMFMDERHIG